LSEVALKTAVAGVGGYAGAELARLLLAHPRLQHQPPLFLARAADQASGILPLEQLHPGLARGAGHLLPPVHPFSWQLIEQKKIDLVFLALPHEISRAWVPEWIERNVKVVDLSGAWRLDDPDHRALYNLKDNDPHLAATLQEEAVYGSPELHREAITCARLVANPGCYATSIILALQPLVQADLVDRAHGIICDSKSGVSGAGKSPTAKTHFMYAADNLSAYSIFGHRHTGELLEQLGLTNDQIQFTPHLLPIPRGILSTIYLQLREQQTPESIESCLRTFYASSPMVRIHPTPSLPQIQHVAHTSYCDLGFELAPDNKRLVLVSCLDNLLKGAASQAVQNMNLMAGYPEEEGLL
jgi:N-acetyl-gamma-glutamyl-phosphate reductase